MEPFFESQESQASRLIKFSLASLPAPWICVLIIFFLYIVLQYPLQAFRSDLKLVPGPVLARWTGLYRPWALFDGRAVGFYSKLHSQYGTIVRTAPNVVSISDPRAIPTIYATGTRFYKSPFYSVFDVWYKGSTTPSIFSSRDPQVHQALRRPFVQKFSMTSIKTMEPIVDECTDIFMHSMAEMEGKPVDLGAWLQWYSFDVISAMTYSTRLGFMEQQRDVENLIEEITQMFEIATLLGQVPDTLIHRLLKARTWLAHYLPFLERSNALRTIVEFTEGCIAEYDRNPSDYERPDLLGWLRQSNAKGEAIPHRLMVNQLGNNFLAGSDTTAISLRAVFYFLTQKPRCYEKAQNEVDEANRSGRLSEHVTYAESIQLPYLQAVLKEAMRCHPAVSSPLERVVPPEGANLCGFHLSAGTIVGINPAIVHQDKAVFGEDASEFNPDRWLGEDQERIKQMDRHLLTFGYGTRICLGKNISLMEMGKLVPQILRDFDLEWASSESTWRVYTLWFARQEGLVYRLRLRKKP